MHEMIKKILILISTFIFAIYPTKSGAQNININDLITNAKEFNHKIISVKGEVIGESLKRDRYGWVNIKDSTNAIGVYMKNEDIKKIKVYGGYNKIGDKLEVEGVYNKACSEHMGDTDIHAIKVDIIESGIVTEPDVPSYKILIAVGLIMISFSVNYILYKKHK
ncbi:hypothetical protein [Clostridium sp. CCUG 7971]|uniref:hypothetical protein n=1 Tax=Clostridium sp. CCUG 7971 TaxID=2811414 RepID=UPI001ABB8C50|nr:hypothetical protein [Clostridium sp. CCUG 7971]MBO3445114.1 hypothetical protein [Clostridium sp. CCUG 7971]